MSYMHVFKKYQDFKWNSDPKWTAYRDALYPTPALKQFEKIKRKWYKKNVDPDFNVDYDPESKEAKDAE